jgi:hypothetical protein
MRRRRLCPGGTTATSFRPSPLRAGGALLPYAPSPYAPPPQPLYPEGFATPQMPTVGFDYRAPIRFMQEVRGRCTWLSPMGSQSLGVNDVDISATFALPFRSMSPFLITPGFTAHFFEGPVSVAPDFADLPPVTYDAFLDVGWHPQCALAGANRRSRGLPGFNTFSTDVRIMGRGGRLHDAHGLQFALGVVYIDRVPVRRSAGGRADLDPQSHTPANPVPNPKLAHRWTTISNTTFGLCQAIRRRFVDDSAEHGRQCGFNDQADYNDIRVSLGLEAYGYRGLHGFFEVGYVFDRQIIYRGGSPEYNPSDTIMLRAGVGY